MKKFNIGIGSNYSIKKDIRIDINKYKLVSDLVEIITSEFNLKNVKFEIDKPLTEALTTIDEKYSFKIQIIDPSSNINFQIQNNKTIEIKKASEMNGKDIFDYLKNDNIYYSEKCISDDIYFFYKDIEIDKKMEKPFENLPPNATIQLKLKNNPITLQYPHFPQFTFSQNEKISSVTYFIQENYDKNFEFYIKLYRKKENRYLSTNDLLQEGDTLYSIYFNQIFSNDQIKEAKIQGKQFQIDYLTTVSNLKAQLAGIYGVPQEEVTFLNIPNDPDKMIKDLTKGYPIKFEIPISEENIVPKKNETDKKADEKASLSKLRRQRRAKNASKNPTKEESRNPTKETQKNPTKETPTIPPKEASRNPTKETPTKEESRKPTKETQKNPTKEESKNPTKETPTIPSKETLKNPTKETLKNPTKETPNASRDSVKIFFSFEDRKKNFHETFPLSTQIKAVEKYAAEKYNIKDKVQVCYEDSNENKIPIDSMQTLNNVRDKMNILNGPKVNVLFIKIITNKQTNAQQNPTKPKPPSERVEPPKQQKQIAPKVQPKTRPVKEDEPVKKPTEVRYTLKQTNDAVIPEVPQTNFQATKRPPPKEKSYNFMYKDRVEKLNLKSDTTLKSNEDKIRKLFKINSSSLIQYRTSLDADSNGERVEDWNTKMEIFNGKTIKIFLDFDRQFGRPGTVIYKYFYRINRGSDVVHEMEFPMNTQVRQMKQKIAQMNGVSNFNNIKILFAGKDLLNGIILDDLEIGPTIIFVYIRSQEDIILKTARALKFDPNADEYEYEYEYYD